MLAAVMATSSDSFQLVTIADAVRILNVSDSTVRRLIRAGRLEAQRVERAQGHVWLVKVPSSGHQPSAEPPRQLGAADGQPSAPPALAAWITSVLEPVMAELSLSRQQLVSQAETIGMLRAENDALRAENDALRAAQSPIQPRETASRPEATTEPSVPPWRSWPALELWALLAALIAAGVAAVLLAWPR
jgi:excisionase family DNA binding protein